MTRDLTFEAYAAALDAILRWVDKRHQTLFSFQTKQNLKQYLLYKTIHDRKQHFLFKQCTTSNSICFSNNTRYLTVFAFQTIHDLKTYLVLRLETIFNLQTIPNLKLYLLFKLYKSKWWWVDKSQTRRTVVTLCYMIMIITDVFQRFEF